MKNEVTGHYDLTDNTLDVWHEIHPDSDNFPTPEQLAEVRDIIKAHYRTTATAVGGFGSAHYDDCGVYNLFSGKARAGREQGIEVDFKAAPAFDATVKESLV